MAHVGEVGKKIQTEVIYKKSITVYNRFCSPYNYSDSYLHIFEDAEGNELVWKTTSALSIQVPYTGKPGHHNFEDRKGNPIDYAPISVESKLSLSGTVKAHKQYKETDQTVLTRCKFSIIEMAMTEEEKMEKKAKEQKESLKEGDFVWKMPYKQYKEHYSDCETLAGSYDRDEKTVKVIIRSGRIKNNGVRGQIFFNVTFKLSNGRIRCYKAVSERTARNQLVKDLPEEKDAEIYRMEPYSYRRW